jgi:peptidoglycan/LPS O-acetylase OafA/YrhL
MGETGFWAVMDNPRFFALFARSMQYIKGFDALRGLSVVLVVITHLGFYHHLPENAFVRERVWLLFSGSTGVLVFFTLSGFLITRLLIYEKNTTRKIRLGRFFLSRLLRLLPPLVLFYSVLSALMLLKQLPLAWEGLLFSLFYLYNFVPPAYLSAELSHTWSLAVEEQFYLVWPFVIRFFSEKKRWFLIGFFLLLSLFLVHEMQSYPPDRQAAMNRWFFPAVCPVLVGSLSALLIHSFDAFANRIFSEKKGPLFWALVLFVFPLYSPFPSFSFLFQASGMATLLVWIVFNQQNAFVQSADHGIPAFLGKISYGIYVYQGLFLRTGPTGELWIQQFPQNVILTLAAALLSYRFVEKPILEYKKRMRPFQPDLFRQEE